MDKIDGEKLKCNFDVVVKENNKVVVGFVVQDHEGNV